MFEPNTPETITDIAHTILMHFGVDTEKSGIPKLLQQMQRAQKLVLVVADGLGYNFLERNTIDDQRIASVKAKSQIAKIRSVFPSSTAPALLTLNSGETPVEHGLLEWNMYASELDDVINPLPYRSVTHDKPLPELPEMLFRGKTMYQRLQKEVVRSYFFVPEIYIDSPFTKMVSKGATRVGYTDGKNLMCRLLEAMEATTEKAYYYVYWPDIDKAEHVFGPSSNEAKQSLKTFLDMLFNDLLNKLSIEVSDTSFLMVTADHGQIDVKPEHVYYLNDYPEIIKAFQLSPAGKPILPSGNGRDMFLHIQDSQIKKVAEQLTSAFGTVADIITMDKAAIEKLFGYNRPHPEFTKRLGTILILPKDKQKIWFRYRPDKTSDVLGDHGGLSDDEMYVPLLGAMMSDLV